MVLPLVEPVVGNGGGRGSGGCCRCVVEMVGVVVASLRGGCVVVAVSLSLLLPPRRACQVLPETPSRTPRCVEPSVVALAQACVASSGIGTVVAVVVVAVVVVMVLVVVVVVFVSPSPRVCTHVLWPLARCKVRCKHSTTPGSDVEPRHGPWLLMVVVVVVVVVAVVGMVWV